MPNIFRHIFLVVNWEIPLALCVCIFLSVSCRFPGLAGLLMSTMSYAPNRSKKVGKAPEWTKMTDLASGIFGGRVLFATDGETFDVDVLHRLCRQNEGRSVSSKVD